MHRDHVITFKALKESDNSVIILKLIGNCGDNNGFEYVMEKFKWYDSPFLLRYFNNSEENWRCQVWTREVCQQLGFDGVL